MGSPVSETRAPLERASFTFRSRDQLTSLADTDITSYHRHEMKRARTRVVLIAVLCMPMLGAASRASSPEYSIKAVRYATSPDVSVSELVVGGRRDQKVDIAMVVWLIRGGGRTILFDSGFHRDTFLKDFPMKEYLPPASTGL